MMCPKQVLLSQENEIKPLGLASFHLVIVQISKTNVEHTHTHTKKKWASCTVNYESAETEETQSNMLTRENDRSRSQNISIKKTDPVSSAERATHHDIIITNNTTPKT